MFTFALVIYLLGYLQAVILSAVLQQGQLYGLNFLMCLFWPISSLATVVLTLWDILRGNV